MLFDSSAHGGFIINSNLPYCFQPKYFVRLYILSPSAGPSTFAHRITETQKCEGGLVKTNALVNTIATNETLVDVGGMCEGRKAVNPLQRR